jgi:hypothetical protein
MRARPSTGRLALGMHAVDHKLEVNHRPRGHSSEGTAQASQGRPQLLPGTSCWRQGGRGRSRPTHLSRDQSGAADGSRADRLRVPADAEKQGRQPGQRWHPAPNDAASLAAGEQQVPGRAPAGHLHWCDRGTERAARAACWESFRGRASWRRGAASAALGGARRAWNRDPSLGDGRAALSHGSRNSRTSAANSRWYWKTPPCPEFG